MSSNNLLRPEGPEYPHLGIRRLPDLTPAWQGETPLAELVADLTPDDLRTLTNEMVDTMLALIADCTDEDVTFVPVDPKADDPYADDESERHMPWTLGHVIVHTTAVSALNGRVKGSVVM